MSPRTKESPSSARVTAFSSIAGEESTPSVDLACSRLCASAVSSPVPHPRSTTRIPGLRRTIASRSKNGRERSARNRA